MKIRKGFVSNSSSSSFVLNVALLSEEKCFELFEKLQKMDDYEYHDDAKLLFFDGCGEVMELIQDIEIGDDLYEACPEYFD